jgi:hypothetical protein
MFRGAGSGRRRVGKALPVGLVLGVVASSALVWQASQAAFTGQTSTDNHVGAGTVVISNERTGLSLLTVAALAPGRSAAECVLVTYAGTADAAVRLHAGSYADTGNLGGTLTIAVESADTGAYGNNCATFAGNVTTILPAEPVDTFAARASFGTGVPATSPWQPTGAGQVKAFRITVTLPGGATNALQGTSLDVALVWEARSV